MLCISYFFISLSETLIQKHFKEKYAWLAQKIEFDLNDLLLFHCKLSPRNSAFPIFLEIVSNCLRLTLEENVVTMLIFIEIMNFHVGAEFQFKNISLLSLMFKYVLKYVA